MRIVIATPFYPPEKGVLGTYAEGLEGAFQKLGHDVTVASFDSMKWMPPVVRHITFFLHVYRLAWTTDFILALDTWSVGMPAFFAARFAKVPLLIRIGGDFLWETYIERTKMPIRFSEFYGQQRMFSLKEKWIFKFHCVLAHSARALIFNSQFQRGIWLKAYDIAVDKTHVVENVFPSERSHEPAQGRVFVSAGRPIILKKYDELKRAFARVQNKFPDLRLDTRLLPRDEHLARLRNCYAVVIPSVSEMSSNMAVDAVVHGKPFIMTDDTGTKERFGECGVFVDTRSEDALAVAVEKLLDENEYGRLQNNIRSLALERSWDDLAREILAAV